MDIANLLKYWEKDNSNKSLAAEIARVFGSNRDLNGAFEFFNSLSSELRSDSDTNWQFAWVAITQQDFDKAKEILNCLAENNPAYMYGMALISFLQHQFEVAREYLQPLINASEPAASFIILEMRCLYYLGALENALELGVKYSNTISTPELNGLIALLALDSKKLELSSEYANKTLREDPQQLDASLAMASLLINQQQFEEAFPICQMLNSRHESSGRGWSLSGQLHLVKSDITNAKQCFENAVSYMPDHIGTWHLKAWAELLSDDVAAAKISFQKALDLNRNFADSHAGIALVMIYQGNIDSAKQKIKLAKKLDDQCQTAIFAQSMLLRLEGKAQEADSMVAGIIGGQSHLQGHTYQALIAKLSAQN